MPEDTVSTDPLDEQKPQAPSPDHSRYPGMPGWVKAVVVVGAALAGALLVLGLVQGGHGPGRHGSLHDSGAAATVPVALHWVG